MKIDFENGSLIKTIGSKEQAKRSSDRTIRIYPLTLDYVEKYHCPNCINWRGNNHDYGCETCMKRIEWSQLRFGQD